MTTFIEPARRQVSWCWKENANIFTNELTSFGQRAKFLQKNLKTFFPTEIILNFKFFSIILQTHSRIWNIEKDSSKQPLYISFALTVASLTYKNFEKLQRFANETQFSQVDLLMIARKMKTEVQLVNSDFTYVVTEVCVQIKCEATRLYSLKSIPHRWEFVKAHQTTFICRIRFSPSEL